MLVLFSSELLLVTGDRGQHLNCRIKADIPIPMEMAIHVPGRVLQDWVTSHSLVILRATRVMYLS